MKLTTIIPVHNAQKYITATLDSVLSQNLGDLGTPEDLEVICVDDASTDSSVSLIKEYQQRDSRIRLFLNEKTQYAGACRNRGIEEAHGEYVHFLDADDLVQKDAYCKFLKLAADTGADMVKGCADCFDNETQEHSDTPLLALSDIDEKYFNRILNFHQAPEVFSHISVVPWNAVYKREFLIQNHLRFNDLICVNDRSFYSEAVFTAGKIWLTHEQIVHYRVNNGASLMGNRARNFQCEFKSWQLIMEQCEKYKIQGQELAIVMERELIDIFIWYRKYKKIPEISEEITSQTRAFAKELDITPLEAFPPSFKWYYDYLTFMPEFETLSKNYNNITSFKKQAKKIMPECATLAEFQEKIQETSESAALPKSQSMMKKVIRHILKRI